MENKILIWIVVILLFALAGFAFSQIRLVVAPLTIAGCMDVYCDDFEFICCGEKEETKTVTITQLDPLLCTSEKCIITSISDWGLTRISDYLYVGSKNCRMEDPIWASPYWKCDDEKYSYLPITAYNGQYVYNFDRRLGKYPITFTFKYYFLRLAWCGDAACDVGVTGIKVAGSTQCTFVTDKRVYDEYGKLITDPEGSQISKTVPKKSCYLSYKTRHICGSTCETCINDENCAIGHSLRYNGLGAECKTGQLEIYGCKIYGEKPSDFDLLPKEAGDYSYGTRCGVKTSIPVQCCPYTDSCGEGFCDPETYTCKMQEVKCSYDYECGQAQYCDREKKELVKPVCKFPGTPLSECVNEKIQDVNCCYDADCASGWYCDIDYTCKEGVTPCTECAYECCENECTSKGGMFDKPCQPGQNCVEHKCSETPPPPVKCLEECEKMSDWNPAKQFCKLRCWLVDKLKTFGMILLGLIALILVILAVLLIRKYELIKR